MKDEPRWRRYLRLWGPDVRADVEDEIEFHIAMRAAEHERSGLTVAESEARARREFGDAAGAKRACRRIDETRVRRERRGERLGELGQDVRYALRSMGKSPAFTVVAVLTLALGIGLNTAVFSVLHALLLRGLPYEDADRLVLVDRVVPRVEREDDRPLVGQADVTADTAWYWSYPKYEVLASATDVFEGLSPFATQELNLTGTDSPERITTELVAADYFRLLGVEARLGRTFVPEEDDVPGGEAVAVVSHGFWQRRFGGGAVLGRTVDLNHVPIRIVGVLPPGRTGLGGAGVDVWLPFSMATVFAWPEALEEPQSHWFAVFGRLREGVSVQRAAASLAPAGARIEEVIPGDRQGSTVVPIPLDAARVSPTMRRAVLVLFGAAGLVLLIALVNLAALVLSRGARRAGELAMRTALGASRGRLVRQLLVESAVLAGVAAVAGLAMAWWGTMALAAIGRALETGSALTTAQLSDFAAIRPAPAALAFGAALSVLAGVAAGIWPALRASAAGSRIATLSGGRTIDGASLRLRAGGRGPLVVLQVALALVLLAGAGLMLRSLAKLRAVDAGFEPQNVLTFRVAQVAVPGEEPPDRTVFYGGLTETLGRLPRVTAAGFGNCPPLAGGCTRTVLFRTDRREYEPETAPVADVHFADPGYLDALGGRLLGGRWFEARDRTGAAKVVVVNRTAAQEFFGGDALGGRLALGISYFPDGETAEVIGVIEDVQHGRPEDPPSPGVYVPLLQHGRATYAFLRTSGDPAALVPEVRRALAGFDRDLPVFDVRTMEERMADVVVQSHMLAVLLTVFAALAVALAAVGLYGVLSYAVAQRSRDIGVRMALGARVGDVLRMVLRQGLTVAMIGVALGIAGALALTRLLEELLFEVQPDDPVTLGAVVALLLGIAAIATLVPAVRAARVDPVRVLKE